MALLESAVLGVGSGIAKGVLKLWLGSDHPIQSEVSATLIDLLKQATGDLLAQRSANRQFEAIAERTAINILDPLEAEGDPVDDALRQRIIGFSSRRDRFYRMDRLPQPV